MNECIGRSMVPTLIIERVPQIQLVGVNRVFIKLSFTLSLPRIYLYAEIVLP